MTGIGCVPESCLSERSPAIQQRRPTLLAERDTGNDKGSEEMHHVPVVGYHVLGMPLDPDHKTVRGPGALYALDNAIRRPGRDPKLRRDLFQSLMVETVDAHGVILSLSGSQRKRQCRPWRHAHCMGDVSPSERRIARMLQ